MTSVPTFGQLRVEIRGMSTRFLMAMQYNAMVSNGTRVPVCWWASWRLNQNIAADSLHDWITTNEFFCLRNFSSISGLFCSFLIAKLKYRWHSNNRRNCVVVEDFFKMVWLISTASRLREIESATKTPLGQYARPAGCNKKPNKGYHHQLSSTSPQNWTLRGFLERGRWRRKIASFHDSAPDTFSGR